MDLKAIYLTTLRQCAPEVLVQPCVDPSMPPNVVAIGKCAGRLLDGIAVVHRIQDAIVAIPDGYPPPMAPVRVYRGGHPAITEASFVAGRAVIDFVNAHDDILFVVSGGGSACMEVPLPPFTESEVVERNATLIASGLPIGEINARRAAVSAIKGGKLGTRVRGRRITLVYSDVSTGAPGDVASGPSIAEADSPILIADNTTLTRAAARIAGAAVLIEQQIERDVAEAAQMLAEHARNLRAGQILVAGGEATVTLRGNGEGGRCVELAVRFAMETEGERFEALFGSSDGEDGNSGVAAIHLPADRPPLDREAALDALGRSDSLRAALQIGNAIVTGPTGNNLRDLFLIAGA